MTIYHSIRHFGGRRDGGGLYDDESQSERALRYSRTQEWLVLAGMLWGTLTSILSLFTGLSARLRERAERIAPQRLGPIVPYGFATMVLSTLASLPLSYYEGYVVEHRFGLSNQTRRAWLADQLKGLGVSLVLGVPLMRGAYWVIQRYPKRWWAVLSGLTIPFAVILSNLAPVLLLPLFNKFEPLKDRALARRLQEMAESQGVHVSDVLQMDMSKQTKKANAFFAGIGNTKRIVLGDTLLDELTRDEVEVVLAHELSHQVRRDIWKLIGLGAAVSLLTFYAVHRLAGPLIERSGKQWGLDPERGVEDVAALPLLGLIAGGVSLALRPVLNGLSRSWIEHPADRYALELTGNRKAFVSAMQKIGRMNLADPRPPALVKYLLYDHPPIQERIDYGRSHESPNGRRWSRKS